MRTNSNSQSLAAACISFLCLAACTGGPLGITDAGGDAAPANDGAPPLNDGATAPDDLPFIKDGGDKSCIGLSACACWKRKDCQVISESCWCPFPECDPNGACGCGGGKFIGCAPASSNCTNAVDCRPAGRPVGPDGKGCYACGYSDNCMEAWTRLKSTCMLNPGIVDGFSCDKNTACVTKCVNDVKQCSDVGCGLCTACVCGNTGSFELCYYACMK